MYRRSYSPRWRPDIPMLNYHGQGRRLIIDVVVGFPCPASFVERASQVPLHTAEVEEWRKAKKFLEDYCAGRRVALEATEGLAKDRRRQEEQKRKKLKWRPELHDKIMQRVQAYEKEGGLPGVVAMVQEEQILSSGARRPVRRWSTSRQATPPVVPTTTKFLFVLTNGRLASWWHRRAISMNWSKQYT
ncbi:hypothetical protein CYMTET_11387 [Cymbomonas tetramitiformis]|uniref:Uncharacterized protein n=1 Tax=Cymbomonas tetramitiformis TaxID=36881 RepID=A0AAE0GME9_9CHLO|nr:hypothetical protein CYMTET_11387 [Cymbomonas tetramitiformis]